MSPVEQFQKRHGAKWTRIVREPAFTDALLLVNAATVQSVTTLSNEEIANKGTIILADLRGRLAYEAALIDLSVLHPELSPNDLPAATYPDPSEDEEESRKPEGGGRMPEEGSEVLAEWVNEPPLAETISTQQPKPGRKRRKK